MKSDRLISLLLLLQAHGKRSARELARELEVSERTIYRDADALGMAGIPVYAERGAGGGITLADGYRRSLSHFGDDEVRALFVSSDDILSDLGLVGQRGRALAKIAGALSTTARKAAEHARGRVHVDQRRWYQPSQPSELLAALRRAVWDDRRIELTYRDREGVPSRREVDPLGLVAKAGIWYVICRDREAIKTFRVQRIVEVRELVARFERPPDFDLAQHWERASAAYGENDVYAVTMRVTTRLLGEIATFWGTDTTSDPDPDDGRMSIVRTRFSSRGAALQQAIAWSTEAEVVEPQELRDMVVERARQMLDRYDAASAPRAR